MGITGKYTQGRCLGPPRTWLLGSLAAGHCPAGTRELSLPSAHSQETALKAAGAARMGAASRAQPSQQGHPPQVTAINYPPLQPAPLPSRQLSPSHSGRETELHCRCETKQKDAGPSPSNNPALPSSPRQQKGTHGAGHSLGKGAGDCG